MIARYHRHRIASAIYEVTLSAQVTITHQRNPFFVPIVTAPSSGGPKFRGRSAIYTVFQLLGSFLLLYVPYYIVILWEASSSLLEQTDRQEISKINPHFFTIASTLLTCSPPVNGFLYGLKNKTLQKTFQNYWRKKLTKSEVNHEIQARTPSTCGSRRPSITPLGFFSKPTIQRRLSEALLDVQKACSGSQRTNIKRISSELTWRPNSTTALNFPACDENRVRLSQTTSCNTLQVPRTDSDEVSFIVDDDSRSKINPDVPHVPLSLGRNSSAHFLHKIFGNDNGDQRSKKAVAMQNVLDGSPKQSPRILITRAYSEDSDKNHSHPTSPAKEAINKRHSTSATTLLERKWKQLRCKEATDDVESGEHASCPTTKPLLDDSSGNNPSSDSSDASEIYMRIDDSIQIEGTNLEVATEDELLLSWSAQRKCIKGDGRKRPPLIKQALVQTHEVIL